MITTFENLPNEVITNIIEYISSPNDIYHAFAGLNQRFDIVLEFVRLSIDIFRENKQNLMLAHYFSTNCDRLRLYNICPSIKLIRFLRLRSLTMVEPAESQSNSIQSRSLPMLEYLTGPATMIIFDCLFGNEHQRWHFLRSCNFLFSPLPNLKTTWQPNYNLCTLSGITCSRTILSQLLVLVPSIKYLHIDMLSDDHSNWITPINIKNLVSLRIGFSRLIYDDISYLIGPKLHRLYLDIYNKSISIDFANLAAFLISIPQKLKQFNCDYPGSSVNINEIRVIHPLFRNMEVVHGYSNNFIKLVCKNMEQSEDLMCRL
ncbi:unnamed protein product [Rotaria sordida]|uniref:Uncharacterized protein n=1 Tax=Rotaria sordida TaxID=392033 RepID=A0A814DPX6_9BILA|nr:unnamed protein product [Rotaria sordida]CAF1040981.1 unnamed protein product [Rotaria sordida]